MGVRRRRNVCTTAIKMNRRKKKLHSRHTQKKTKEAREDGGARKKGERSKRESERERDASVSFGT